MKTFWGSLLLLSLCAVMVLWQLLGSSSKSDDDQKREQDVVENASGTSQQKGAVTGNDTLVVPRTSDDDKDWYLSGDVEDHCSTFLRADAWLSCKDFISSDFKGLGDCDDFAGDDPPECLIGEMDCAEYTYAVCAPCINPGARELNGDDVDSDCDGILDDHYDHDGLREPVGDNEPRPPKKWIRYSDYP